MITTETVRPTEIPDGQKEFFVDWQQPSGDEGRETTSRPAPARRGDIPKAGLDFSHSPHAAQRRAGRRV